MEFLPFLKRQCDRRHFVGLNTVSDCRNGCSRVPSSGYCTILQYYNITIIVQILYCTLYNIVRLIQPLKISTAKCTLNLWGAPTSQKKDKDRRKGKGRRCCLIQFLAALAVLQQDGAATNLINSAPSSMGLSHGYQDGYWLHVEPSQDLAHLLFQPSHSWFDSGILIQTFSSPGAKVATKGLAASSPALKSAGSACLGAAMLFTSSPEATFRN